HDSMPPLLRGKVYADFTDEEMYYPNLLDLVLTLFGVDVEDSRISDLRESVRRQALRPVS
ncbi:MAG TPA: hypothetical protein VGH38_37860, partial [Bryobacteraceae bacterium]